MPSYLVLIMAVAGYGFSVMYFGIQDISKAILMGIFLTLLGVVKLLGDCIDVLKEIRKKLG